MDVFFLLVWKKHFMRNQNRKNEKVFLPPVSPFKCLKGGYHYFWGWWFIVFVNNLQCVFFHQTHSLQDLRQAAVASKVFVQRDYASGTICKFQTKFPAELENRVCGDPEQTQRNYLPRICIYRCPISKAILIIVCITDWQAAVWWDHKFPE